MSESFYTELSKNYNNYLSSKASIITAMASFQAIIEKITADNGYATHGLDNEKQEIELFLRKVNAFINQQ